MLVWLAAGLSDVRFAPVQPVSLWGESTSPVEKNIHLITKNIVEIPFWQQALVMILILIIFAISIMILPGDVRKRLLRALLSAVLIAIAFFYYIENYEELGSPLSLDIAAPFSDPDTTGEISISPEDYEPKPPSPILIYFISVILLLILAGITWRLLRPWLLQRGESTLPLNDIASIARISLDDLSDGQQWEDVIVRAYLQMSEIARDRRGIQRQQAMTPKEFATRLELAGLPADPVHCLTHLFEKVRYGGRTAEENEIVKAKRCLKAILEACGNPL